MVTPPRQFCAGASSCCTKSQGSISTSSKSNSIFGHLFCNPDVSTDDVEVELLYQSSGKRSFQIVRRVFRKAERKQREASRPRPCTGVASC